MKSFLLFNSLLFAFGLLGQFYFFGSDFSGNGERLVLGYVSFVVYFVFFLAFSVYLSLIREREGSRVEAGVMYWLVAPYLSLTWRNKYSLFPILDHEYLIWIAGLIVVIWWIRGRVLITIYKGFALWEVKNEESDLLPGKNNDERSFYMRIIAVVLILLPIPFWGVDAIFVN